MNGSKNISPYLNQLRQQPARSGRARSLLHNALILLLLMLLAGGCSYSNRMDLPPIDLETISDSIVRDVKKSAVLESEEKIEVADERPKIQDMSSRTGATENYASRIKKAAEKGRVTPADEGQEGEGILLNFDNADIFEVIQIIATTLNLNYIIDPQVKGVVNIHSGSKIPLSQLFSIFKKILHINGLDIRSEGDYDYIYVAKKPTSHRINGTDTIGKLSDSPHHIIQIIPLVHLSSQEVTKLVEPYLSNQGSIHDLAEQNTLLINDYESKVVDILRLVAKIDISPLANLHINVIRVDNAPLFELRDELTEVFNALKINRKDYEGISVVPLERVNSLILISNNDIQIQNAIRWIKELDVVPSQDRDNIYIYNVRNSVASELSELINQLIAEEKPKDKISIRKPGDKTPTPQTSKPLAKKISTSTKALSSLRFIGEPVVFADDDRNIILIRALPKDYTRIVKLLERLDNLPRQVLVEVMVAEIQLKNELELGIEWFINSGNYSLGTEFTNLANPGLNPTTPASGFSYVMEYGDVTAFLQALASRNDFAILSSPQILVLNNEQATVNVGQQVPIVTTVTENAVGATQVDKTVQYKDTGIILEVTPQINFNGVILLEVSQTVSKAQENTTSDISSPEISNREIKTKLAVKNGQTILMGGMIDKTNETIQSGVPFLMDIPWLGNLFKYQKDKMTKTELLVTITPHVIDSEDVLDQYILDFEEKLKTLRPHLHTPMGISPRKNW